MVVAVIAMRMVQMSVDQVINVIAMWDRFVSTTRTVNMIGVVTTAIMRRRAGIWIDGGYLQFVFFDLPIIANMM
jgi:hypothetical protein